MTIDARSRILPGVGYLLESDITHDPVDFLLLCHIWFMSDICHLVKTMRNCWENSSKNGTHHLEVLKNLFSYFLVSQQRNGKHILWSHLIELYEWNRENSGLYIGNKLKMEHLKLNS